MNPFVVALWLLPMASVVFVWALIASRAGNSVHHTRAFYSGMVGLFAIPVWLTAIAGLVSQLFWATLSSTAGVFFIVSSVALLTALGFSTASLIGIRRTF